LSLKLTFGLALVFAGGATMMHAQSPSPPCNKENKDAFRTCIMGHHPPGTPAAPLERFLEVEGFVRSKQDPPGQIYFRWLNKPSALARYGVVVVLRVGPTGLIEDVKVN
jgi:hypothetical protein